MLGDGAKIGSQIHVSIQGLKIHKIYLRNKRWEVMISELEISLKSKMMKQYRLIACLLQLSMPTINAS